MIITLVVGTQMAVLEVKLIVVINLIVGITCISHKVTIVAVNSFSITYNINYIYVFIYNYF